MVDDCIKYQNMCEACQRFGNIQLALVGVMNSIVKPWPFRGWVSYPVPRKRERSLHTCAQDVQITRMPTI
jgi:hypothetical protein